MTKTLSQERYGDSLEVLLTFSPSVKYSSYGINHGYLCGDDIIAPWIIQKIRELEEEKKRRKEEQPRVYIDDYPYEPIPEEKEEKESDRGVVVIDMMDPD